MGKSIVIVVPELRGGGAERVLVTLANGLSRKRYKVTMLLTKGDIIDYEICQSVVVIKNTGSRNAIGQIEFIRSQLKRNKPATIISFFSFQNLYTLLASIRLKNRIIVSERNDPSKTLYNKRYLEPIRNFLYRRASAIVFQTKDAQEYFPAYIADKGIIIGNPLRHDLPEPYSREREKRLVAVSRLNKQKNLTMMLDAFEIVHAKHPEYVLELYGQGEEKEEIENYAQKKHLEESVVLKGFCKDVLSRIVKATAFLSSSDYEGVSNSMLEAMAVGLPCICTDCPCGGAKMYINSYDNGILVPVGDSKEMSAAIELVIEDRCLQEKLSQNAVKIKEILNDEIIVDQWKKLI